MFKIFNLNLTEFKKRKWLKWLMDEFANILNFNQ